jgi:hypothetical protein
MVCLQVVFLFNYLIIAPFNLEENRPFSISAHFLSLVCQYTNTFKYEENSFPLNYILPSCKTYGLLQRPTQSIYCLVQYLLLPLYRDKLRTPASLRSVRQNLPHHLGYFILLRNINSGAATPISLSSVIDSFSYSLEVCFSVIARKYEH